MPAGAMGPHIGVLPCSQEITLDLGRGLMSLERGQELWRWGHMPACSGCARKMPVFCHARLCTCDTPAHSRQGFLGLGLALDRTVVWLMCDQALALAR